MDKHRFEIQGDPSLVTYSTAPGKYSGEPLITEYLHNLAQNGADDETGDVQLFGWYAWRFRRVHSDDLSQAYISGGLSVEEVANSLALVRMGCIIVEDSQGFVHLIADKCASRWDSLVRQYEMSLQ
jgi:hypothetical protein